MKLLLSKEVARFVLILGIIAPLIFSITEIVTGVVTKNYNFISQSISELSAVGASTRPYVVSLNIIGYLFVMIFGLGVWYFAEQNWALNVVAILFILHAVFGLVWLFFPMHVGESPSTINVVFGALTVMSLTLAIFFGAVAFSGWFRVLSITIIIIFVLAAIIGLWIAPRFMANSKPTIGVQERTMSYIIYLWMVALVAVLIQTKIS